MIEDEAELEMALPVSLNVVCFRYTRNKLDDIQLNELNKHIEIELQEQGIAVPSIVIINDKKYLHVAITNHRSRREDFDILVREVKRLGREYSN
jgi:glutamate/tyrosine decarboxylase-like PLP-dependent enzyme